MKKVFSIVAAVTLTLAGLSPIAATAAPIKYGAEKGGHSVDYRTPNTNIKVKGSKLEALKDSDYVIVTSKTNTDAQASKFASYKEYLNADSSVYLLSKADALKIKASNPSVTIETAKPITADTTQSPTPSWGLDRIDSSSTLDSTYNYDTTGNGVKAYVIDTGINTASTDFTGRIGTGYTYFNDGYGYTDCNGHGTHVSGTIAGTTYGVAKTATIIPVKVLDCNGSGTNLSVIAGINWVIKTHTGGPAVINMSVGGGYDSSLNNAVASATAAGFTVVVAAGNETADACTKSPASAPSALTVSAVDSANRFASFSNFGTCVDIAAPGVSIKSDYIGSSTATASLSGTSMASPHVAGVVARMLEANPTRTPSQIASDLATLSTKNVITSNPTGTVNQVVTLTSGNTTAPSISVSSNTSGWTTGTPVTGSATVTPNNQFTSSAVLTVSGLPAGVTGTVTGWNVAFSRTPTTAGSYTITYTLTEGTKVATASNAVTVSAPIVAPAMPNPTIVKGSSNLTATVVMPTGNARPDTYVFQTYRNGVLWDTATGTFNSTIVSVKYTTPKISRRSGTYVIKVTASNSAGTSPTFTSIGYTY